jgi:elongation factor Ts
MAKVTPQLIRELRERTAAGMTDCKNALVEAEGDVDKAVELILKAGKAKSAKRASATAAEGEIRAAMAADARTGTLVEVNIQTDFAARNDKFKAFVEEVEGLAKDVKTLDELLAAKMAAGKTVAETRDELIATIGEKIDVRRLKRVELASAAGCVHSYVHMNGKIGVLLAVEAENDAVAKHEAFMKFVDDTAMQIAAMNPLYLDRTEVPATDVDKQKEIFLEQIKGEEKPKPEKAWPMIIEGKVNKWYTEICLVDQNSVIENGKSIDTVRGEAAKAAGGSIKLLGFVRFQLGEGISKQEEDFAEEAKKMAGA